MEEKKFEVDDFVQFKTSVEFEHPKGVGIVRRCFDGSVEVEFEENGFSFSADGVFGL